MSTSEDFPPLGREAFLIKRFERMRLALLKNEAGLLDTSAEVLALDTLELLAKVLRVESPPQELLTALADNLDIVLANADRSDAARGTAVKLAFSILGHQPNGRPNNIRAINNAIAAFEMHYDGGKGTTVDDAERAAYDAYQTAFGHPEKNYAASKTRKVKVTRGAGEVTITEAERLLDSTIRPELRKAGLLPPKPQGRKPKTNAKPIP